MDPYANQAYKEMLIDRALREQALREQAQGRVNRLLPRDWRHDLRVASEQPSQYAFDPRYNR